jgi:hypothetical protein
MWWFAGGILLQSLSGFEYDSLLLTGVFTFALSGSVVAFGAAVGRWVDSTSRLKGKLSINHLALQPFVGFRLLSQVYPSSSILSCFFPVFNFQLF